MGQKVLQNMNIGANLRRLRKAKGLKQKELVAQMQSLGSSIPDDTSYVKIEGGYRNISVRDLVILQTIYKCTYDEFFKGLTI